MIKITEENASSYILLEIALLRHVIKIGFGKLPDYIDPLEKPLCRKFIRSKSFFDICLELELNPQKIIEFLEKQTGDTFKISLADIE